MSFFQPLPPPSPLGLFESPVLVEDESPVDDESPTRRPFQDAPTFPSALFQSHPLVSNQPLRRNHNGPAVLRVWGYVTGVRSAGRHRGPQSDAAFQVHIQSHDDAQEVDLLQPRWFTSRQATECPPVTLAEARRHSPLQLNRLSDHDDGSPIVRVVACEVEPEHWKTVCFCLFDKSHIVGAVVDDGLKPFNGIDVDKGMVSSDVMAEGFENYVARLRREATQGLQPSDQLSVATQAADYHIPRGRHRRQMRRHQSTELKAVKEERNKTSPVPGHTGDAAVPLQDTPANGSLLRRGRRRRQNRRHGLVLRQVGATPSTTAHHSQAGTVVAVQKTTAVTVNNTRTGPERPAGLPGRRRLGDEAFSALTKESVIWLKTRNPNEFDSELLVLPIHHDDGDGQNLGYLVLPKDGIQAWVDHSWVGHMTSNGADFSVDKLFVLDKAGPTPVSMKYWDKFLAEAVDEFIWGLESSNLAMYTAGDVMLALQTSLQNPPLIFPDSMLGALADVRIVLVPLHSEHDY
ncbi:hypothetical protein C8A01DRAFT_13608 [Parachaetomium inaequale]|uniref:Uncharacterized protein n=1 Tax=Parachaetomium inaequale TaxID=2588326 RepID=A0AAN6PLA0_9PEZI|nr:hypothetical protein C8A01DRAFT_13608 [Parachaetomium inaequale]